jgi:hypothetical protein
MRGQDISAVSNLTKDFLKTTRKNLNEWNACGHAIMCPSIYVHNWWTLILFFVWNIVKYSFAITSDLLYKYGVLTNPKNWIWSIIKHSFDSRYQDWFHLEKRKYRKRMNSFFNWSENIYNDYHDLWYSYQLMLKAIQISCIMFLTVL